MATRLYYVGDREALRHYETGIPARDLVDEDLESVATAWTDAQRDSHDWTPAAVRDYLASTVAYQKSKPRELDETPAPSRAPASPRAEAPSEPTAPAMTERPSPPTEARRE